MSGYVDRVQGKFPEEVQGKIKLGGAAKGKDAAPAGAAAAAATDAQGGCSC